MKKLLLLSLVTMTTLMMTACGEDSEANSTATDAVVDGYSWEIEGITINIGDLEADTVEHISEESNYFEEPSCASDGIDRVYSYNNYEILFSETNGVFGVSMIRLTSDLVSTIEGVSIGDSVESAKEACGEPTDETEGVLLYIKGETELRLIISEEEVVWIEIAKIF